MKSIFYMDYLGTLPVSPGSYNSEIIFTPAGDYCGIVGKSQTSNTAPGLGVSDDSQINVLRYRYVAKGAQGLRAPVTLNQYSNEQLAVFEGRGNSLIGENLLPLPFIEENEWFEVNRLYKITDVPSLTKTPKMNAPSAMYFDTRNLQSLYYETDFVLELQIETEFVPNY